MSFALRWRDYVTLYDLARRRLDSPEAYQSFQRFQGELLVRFLNSHGLNLHGQSILDLGCGHGGYSVALQGSGAKVIGVDRFPMDVAKKMDLVCSDALVLPFASAQFDLVICSSLIEHVLSPSDLIQEMLRVLRVCGVAYLSFPPFYTPLGGHQFSPFHLLGERIALQIARARGLYRGNQLLEKNYPTAPTSFSKAFGDWGLYPLTIGKVERILRVFPVQVMERSTRWLPIDFSGIPVLREFLTWHVQFLLRKVQ